MCTQSRKPGLGVNGTRSESQHVGFVLTAVALTGALCLAGCATAGRLTSQAQTASITSPVSADQEAATRSPQETNRLEADRRCLASFATQLSRMAGEMEQLKRSVNVTERGYFTSDEHDRIEGLLFRYLTCRQALWEMVDAYADYQERFTSVDTQVRAFLIRFNAAVQLASYSSLFVVSFMDNPRIVAKLNEDYHRLGIRAGTYDSISASVTSIDNLERLRTAWHLFANELTAPQSALRGIIATDAAYRGNIDEICALYAEADTRAQHILERKALLLPDVANRLRQSMIADLARLAREKAENNLAAAQAVLFLNVSRLKDPLAVPTRFSEAQIREMRSLLNPGDIILTYSAGYMSNVFLPGVFKHGITYVATPQERQALGLKTHRLCNESNQNRQSFLAHVETAILPTGQPAELVEAVAEGVIFNSLEAILDGHVSRMVVLRPMLTPDESRQALGTVFEYIGDDYDFDFDFSDASAQCCTEVIYRALNRRGACDLKLVPRLGRPTLAADDIIQEYVAAPGRAFTFLLLAEQDARAGDGRATLLTGTDGDRRLRALMTEGQ